MGRPYLLVRHVPLFLRLLPNLCTCCRATRGCLRCPWILRAKTRRSSQVLCRFVDHHRCRHALVVGCCCFHEVNDLHLTIYSQLIVLILIPTGINVLNSRIRLFGSMYRNNFLPHSSPQMMLRQWFSDHHSRSFRIRNHEILDTELQVMVQFCGV